MIQARIQQIAQEVHQDPSLTPFAEQQTVSSSHQDFIRQINQLAFDSGISLAEKQRLLYALNCRCCGMSGGAASQRDESGPS